MGNIRTMTQIETIDPNIKRGVSYSGILDLNELKKKLQDNFSAMVYSDKKTANEFLRISRGGDERIPGRTFRAMPEWNSKLVIAPAAHLRYSFNYTLGAFGVTDNEHGSLEKWGCSFLPVISCIWDGGRVPFSLATIFNDTQ